MEGSRQHDGRDDAIIEKEEKTMDLLDRYITAVGKNLPLKNRGDIQTEIRSTLEDMLEDRSQKAGRPVDDAMLVEVLKAYGAPDTVAATYSRERYLIGPRLYPIFTLVIKVVFIVLSVLAAVGLGLAAVTGPITLQAMAKTFGSGLLQYFGTIMTAFGNIVLVFAIMERLLPDSAMNDLEVDSPKEWDPRSLMKEPETDAVPLWEPVLSIVVTFIGLVILNFYPQVIAFTPSLNNLGSGTVIFYPLLSEAFFSYVPWITLAGLMEIGRNILLFRRGQWNMTTRLLFIGGKMLAIVIAKAMLFGPSIVGLTPASLSGLNVDTATAERLIGWLSQGLQVVLLLAIIGAAVEIARTIYRMVIKPAGVKPVVIK
jgi:hypothetical protein